MRGEERRVAWSGAGEQEERIGGEITEETRTEEKR